MNDVRKQLLKEIDQKIEKKRRAKEKAASNKDVESFILEFLQEIDDIQKTAPDEALWALLAGVAEVSLRNKIQTIDARASVSVSWYEEEGRATRANGVHVKWSPFYVQLKDCEPELFIDVASLLFR